MHILEALFFGFLQGITEFLPVSSSGHLAIFKGLFGIKDVGITFDIMLHVGTLAAVFAAFYRDIWQLIVSGFGIIGNCAVNAAVFVHNTFNKNDKWQYRKVISTVYERFAMLVIVATVPTGITGVLFDDLIGEAGRYMIIPGICLLITGIMLLIADSVRDGNRDAGSTSYIRAGIIGICQGFATLPGISRSGTTITASLVNGLSREFAVKYSFIMSIPVILGAAVLQIPDLASESEKAGNIANYAAGTAMAAIVGYISIRTMLRVVRGKKFRGFAIYCFAMGIFAVISYFII